MCKVNIANYFVYDIANKFRYLDSGISENEVTGLVAEAWNKKHFVSGRHDVRFNHNDAFKQNLLI